MTGVNNGQSSHWTLLFDKLGIALMNVCCISAAAQAIPMQRSQGPHSGAGAAIEAAWLASREHVAIRPAPFALK
jgi:hypothetical protein